ncbi:MAG: proline dehydrogenase [Hyphomicrobiales bacterium]|nr:MAG: proline dehydrogenase [Hyphomicrobiales bacterium]
MLRRVWQKSMIALARSERITAAMQNGRATSQLASRYVAGSDVPAAIERARALREKGILVSLFYLGEYVTDRKEIARTVELKKEAARGLGSTGLGLHVSVDPTQIGLGVDEAMMRRNAFRIAQELADVAGSFGDNGGEPVCLMFDMEDATTVDTTLALSAAVDDAELPVAQTLQAYLRRTEQDLRRLIARGGMVRLVKGAFAGDVDIAFTRNTEIKANYRRLIDMMFSRQALNAGFYPVVATHDHRLHEHAMTRAEENGWDKSSFEFEMLLGVRTDVAEALAKDGYRVRLYTPFGRDWWPYAIRRIGENPASVPLLVRSLLQ